MNALSEFLISLFESFGLYSSQNGLGEHLRGLDIKCVDYTAQSIYTIVFISLFVINGIIMLNYYYGLLNRIPFNRWWWWLINVLAGALILFIIAYTYPNNDLSTGNYCNQLHMSSSDCAGFGFTAAIYSIIWCLLLSLFIKWKSSINKKSPF